MTPTNPSSQNAAPLDKARQYETTIKGVRIIGRVSPCSWMYPTYGLQVHATIAGQEGVRPNAGSFLLDKATPYEKATPADVDRLMATLDIAQCSNPGCPHPRLLGGSVKPDETRCEFCFIAAINAKFNDAVQKEKKKFDATKAKMKRAGYTHVVHAVIHPKSGSDREVAYFYKGAPTEAQIKQMLKQARCTQCDQYRVEPL